MRVSTNQINLKKSFGSPFFYPARGNKGDQNLKRILCWLRKLITKGDGQGFLEDWKQKGHHWEDTFETLKDGSTLDYWTCSVCGVVSDGERFYPIFKFGFPRLEHPSAKKVKQLSEKE